MQKLSKIFTVPTLAVSALVIAAVVINAVAISSYSWAEPCPVACELTKNASLVNGAFSAEQRSDALLSFDAAERHEWSYLPWGHVGLSLKDLDERQRPVVIDAFTPLLSEFGRKRMEGVFTLEAELQRNTWFKWFRDPNRYYLALFSDQSDKPFSGPFMMRLGGHHLSLNATVVGNRLSATPLFFGANPARVDGGELDGYQLMGEEQRQARALYLSLNAEQRAKALLSEESPWDIITSMDAQLELPCCEGLAAEELDTAQRTALIALLRHSMGALANAAFQELWLKVEAAGIGQLHFSWAGSTEVGEGHYYRIHSPAILLEYDNTQNDANHVHLVLREPGADFGAELLRTHRAMHH